MVVLAGALVAWRARDGDDGAATSGSGAGEVACPATDGSGWNSITTVEGTTAVPTDPSGTMSFEVSAGRWRQIGPHQWQVVLRSALANDTPETQSVGPWLYPAVVVARRPFPATCFSARDSTVAPGLIDDVTVGFDVACDPTGRVAVVVGSNGQREHAVNFRTGADTC